MELPAKYIFEDGIYINKEQHFFGYSDGDQIEDYLLKVIKNSEDVSIGSEELALAIKDWPGLYHLSPRRADLLRPFTKELKGKKILEVGCGCGAITRFLGELGAQVIAVEGSLRRAKITAARCRDLKNVTVVCDNLEQFESAENFDYTTLIGVLEYSNLYLSSDNPSAKMLQIAKRFLKKDGSLLIAIENKLGLKYWAGAPEDHLGKPYIGIEGKYDKTTPVTYGRTELSDLLKASGYKSGQFYYPFPDYKFPDTILTEQAFIQPNFTIGNLLIERFDYFQDQLYYNKFSTTLVAKSLQANNLLKDFSNSFLVVATLEEKNPETYSLAYTYSTGRAKKYCKENTITVNDNGEIDILRNYLYEADTRSGATISNTIVNEAYTKGTLLFEEFHSMISRKGWQASDLHSWAQKYYHVLSSRAYTRNNESWLPGKYIDLTPFNVIIEENGNPFIFDQEWETAEDIPLYYVFFRGIIYCISRIKFFETPAPETPVQIIDLAIQVANTVMPFSKEQFDYCYNKEIFIFSEVILGPVNPFGFFNLVLLRDFENETQKLEQQLNEREQQLNEKGQQLNEKENEINDMKQILQQLLDEVKTLQTNQDLFTRNTQYEFQEHVTGQHNTILQQLNMFKSEMSEQMESSRKAIQTLMEIKNLQEIENNSLQKILSEKEADLLENELLLKKQVLEYETGMAQLKDEILKLSEEKEKLSEEKEWYKRTYENRSILGVLKEKIKRPPVKD